MHKLDPRRVQVVPAGARRHVALRGSARAEQRIADDRRAERGDVLVTYADVTKAREKLGYDPHTTVGEGVERFVAWYRARAPHATTR